MSTPNLAAPKPWVIFQGSLGLGWGVKGADGTLVVAGFTDREAVELWLGTRPGEVLYEHTPPVESAKPAFPERTTSDGMLMHKHTGPPVETIDLTPTWAGILPVLMVALEEGTHQARSAARTELQRMAKLADLYVKEHKA